MPSWRCGLCESEERYPSKGQAMDHIRENHVETLIRSAMERSDDDPNVPLPEPVES